jgi:hypothetical protein
VFDHRGLGSQPGLTLSYQLPAGQFRAPTRTAANCRLKSTLMTTKPELAAAGWLAGGYSSCYTAAIERWG